MASKEVNQCAWCGSEDTDCELYHKGERSHWLHPRYCADAFYSQSASVSREAQGAEPEGKKFDDGKLRWDLMPWDALEKVCEVITYGAKKYGDNNWQMVARERYFAAGMRHRVQRNRGELYDKESGLLHQAHACCNDLFELHKELEDIDE